MHRSALFLVAAVLCTGIYAEEVSKNVTSVESVKSVNPGESSKLVSPAVIVDYLHPYPVDFLHTKKKYTLYCDQTLDFMSAWRKCMDNKQELATIESAEEHDAFKVVMGSHEAYTYTSGVDLGKEGSWMWLVNQRPIPGWNQFTAWDSGEPNNLNVENCLVAFIKNGKLWWNDIACGNAYCYVCQELIV